MVSPELQALMAQMCDFFAAMIQQQQTAMEAMLNNERGRSAAQAQGINEKYCKRAESFNGEQAWRGWSFQFKSTTKTANEAAYHEIETAEKEEKEIDDVLSLSEEEGSLSSGIFNILGTLVKGELLQMLHTSGFSGLEAWRKLSKRYSPTTPMRGMQLMMAAINPGKAKGLEEVMIHIDRWEAKVLALSRDFNELPGEKLRAAILISMLPPDLQHALIQQADKIEDYKSTRDRVATIVEAKLALKNPDAMECDAVHRSTGHAEAWEDSEACGVDAVNSKSSLFCYRCSGQGHIRSKVRYTRPNQGERERWRKGRKSRRQGRRQQEERQRRVAYCGKNGHGPRDCWTKQKDEANNGKTDVGEFEEDIGGFEIGCVDREDVPARAADFQHVPGTE